MKKVPYCNDCEYCKEIVDSYLSFYCDLIESKYQISVDYVPPRSPKWCPKRK